MDSDQILELWSLDGLSDARALQVIGVLIDHAGDSRDAALVTRALACCEELGARDLSASHCALLIGGGDRRARSHTLAEGC